MATTKTAETAKEKLTLVSPGGYEYEVTVSDSGNLHVTRIEDVSADGDSDGK